MINYTNNINTQSGGALVSNIEGPVSVKFLQFQYEPIINTGNPFTKLMEKTLQNKENVRILHHFQ